MVWAATEGAAFRLRDGKKASDPVRVVGLAPVPFTNLDELELKRLGGGAIVILKTPAEAREFERRAKEKHGDGGHARRDYVRVKTAVHNARLWARRKQVSEAVVAELVGKAMVADPELTWQAAVKGALDEVAKQAEARREERAARLPAPLPSAPKRGRGGRAPARAEDDADDDDADEEDGSETS